MVGPRRSKLLPLVLEAATDKWCPDKGTCPVRGNPLASLQQTTPDSLFLLVVG